MMNVILAQKTAISSATIDVFLQYLRLNTGFEPDPFLDVGKCWKRNEKKAFSVTREGLLCAPDGNRTTCDYQ